MRSGPIMSDIFQQKRLLIIFCEYNSAKYIFSYVISFKTPYFYIGVLLYIQEAEIYCIFVSTVDFSFKRLLHVSKLFIMYKNT